MSSASEDLHRRFLPPVAVATVAAPYIANSKDKRKSGPIASTTKYPTTLKYQTLLPSGPSWHCAAERRPRDLQIGLPAPSKRPREPGLYVAIMCAGPYTTKAHDGSN